MRVTNLSHWLQHKRLLLILAGGVFMLSAVAVASPQFTASGNQKNEKSATPAVDTGPAGATGDSEAARSVQIDNAVPTSPPASAQTLQVVPPTEESDSEKRCEPLLKKLTDDFDRDVAKDKSDLDLSITNPLPGAIHIENYINRYNERVARTHQYYQQAAGRASCSFPIQSPPLLAPDYLPPGL